MWRWRLPLLELVPCLDWEFCCFQLYLGSSSGLDIALEEVCWCNLDCDIQHCYSPRCYPLCARYWVTTITITDITTLTSHSLYPSHVGWSIRNKFTSNVCRLCGVLLSDIHMEIKPLLFHFSSFFACIPRLFNGNRWPSEHWSSWRYTSYLATRTREIEEK